MHDVLHCAVYMYYLSTSDFIECVENAIQMLPYKNASFVTLILQYYSVLCKYQVSKAKKLAVAHLDHTLYTYLFLVKSWEVKLDSYRFVSNFW